MADGSVQGFTQDVRRRCARPSRPTWPAAPTSAPRSARRSEGETVVDLWGGFADAAKTRPWEKDTIVNVYSTTKTMTALTALLLADRGELDFDAPVARYWPEFAANGKAGVKVSHLMAHSAGLSGWTRADHHRGPLRLGQGHRACWPPRRRSGSPGRASGYHAITQGYLVGEVVRRITGKSLGTFFREEIAEPLGADFHIGLPASEDDRVAELIPPPPGPGGRRRPADRDPEDQLQQSRHRRLGHHAPAPGAAPRSRPPAARATPARSPQIHTILANGGVAKGKRFMSEAGCRKALELQIEGPDLVLGMPAALRHGLRPGRRHGAAAQPAGQHVLGRLRRLDHHDRHGGPHHASPTP